MQVKIKKMVIIIIKIKEDLHRVLDQQQRQLSDRIMKPFLKEFPYIILKKIK